MPPTSASGPPIAAAAPAVLVPVALLHTLLTIATVDSRTGVLGYPAWRVHALNRLTDQDRTTVPVALLVLDLDAFSSLNAAHGHLAGDQILARVADVIRQAIAPDGVVGRFGGDEFVALLPAGRRTHPRPGRRPRGAGCRPAHRSGARPPDAALVPDQLRQDLLSATDIAAEALRVSLPL
jgi:GGDEF domain-containing protein